MTLGAAEAVATVDGGDVLAAIGELVERGMLLRLISDVLVALRKLEPVRLFAVATLEESGEAAAAAEAHAGYFSDMSRIADPELASEGAGVTRVLPVSPHRSWRTCGPEAGEVRLGPKSPPARPVPRVA